MLYTNDSGRCRLFQTTIKNRKIPYLKSTDLNRIQVIRLTCNIQDKQHYCTMLATATGNCAATNVTYNENKYYVVTWTVYLESSMCLRRRQPSEYVRSLLCATSLLVGSVAVQC